MGRGKTILIALLVLCLLPIPAQAVTWSDVGHAIQWTKSDDGKAVLLTGFVISLYVYTKVQKILRGPKYYKYNGRKFVPYKKVKGRG